MLGAERITSLTQDHPNARHCNNAYGAIRDAELRAHPWGFAKKRAVLTPHAMAPAFDFTYAFPLPSDCLRPLPPARTDLDWQIENHEGANAILTNDGSSINLTYIARVTDPVLFDPLFVLALAASLARHLAEPITQSNTKKEAAGNWYKAVMSQARLANAIEQIATEAPEDPWLAARR